MLDESQKEQVRQWAAEGAGLSEIQRRIKDEFGISMTYMDVRFLMLDLHADVRDKPEPKPAAGSWTCPTCGNKATTNFCPACGTKKPAPA